MGPGKFIISLNNLTGARPRVRRRVVCECFDVFHTKKGSGCSGTTGRSADRLPFLVAVPLGDITACMVPDHEYNALCDVKGASRLNTRSVLRQRDINSMS